MINASSMRLELDRVAVESFNGVFGFLDLSITVLITVLIKVSIIFEADCINSPYLT